MNWLAVTVPYESLSLVGVLFLACGFGWRVIIRLAKLNEGLQATSVDKAETRAKESNAQVEKLAVLIEQCTQASLRDVDSHKELTIAIQQQTRSLERVLDLWDHTSLKDLTDAITKQSLLLEQLINRS